MLWPFQDKIVERVGQYVEQGRRRILVVLATGGGKTVVGTKLIADHVQAGGRVLFMAHRRELIDQASKKLHRAGVHHGIVQAGFPSRPGEPVQVASIQTLHARAVRTATMALPRADLVMVDEAHHVRARTYRKLLEAYPDAVVLGLTATPCRGDGRGLGNAFEVMVEGPPIVDLISDGYLVPTKVYAPSIPDLAGIGIRHGDYVESQLAERMDDVKLIGDVVVHWHRLAERRKTVVFATGVGHSIHLRDEFRRTGVLAEHIDGSTPVEERDAILAKLAKGSVEVVVNCAVLTEGWDSPEVSCLVLARPTKSMGLFRQMVGRVLRKADGKTDALILDHAGAIFEHGFVEDPVKWTLDEDKRAENQAQTARTQKRARALKTCPECTAVRWEGQACKACGWHPHPKPVAVEVIDGDLSMVDRKKNVQAAAFDAEQRGVFYRMLLSYSRMHGYKDGWAAHKFKEKFNDWPTAKPWQVQPLTPDDAILSWIKSRQIAYSRKLGKYREQQAWA